MGESTCLIQQPFCYASGISNEANERNPIHALGQSISFGRFMSESLAWEKWSTFSHNRYVEEAERYSRPGSVAQKKAFFEAHYKKLAAQKAAALLEQANNAASNSVTEQQQEGVVDYTHNSQKTSPKSKVVVNEEQYVKVPNTEPDAILNVTGYGSNSNMEAKITESNRVDGANPEKEPQAFVGNSMKVELQNQLEEVDKYIEVNEGFNRTPPMDKTIMKRSSKSDQEVLASASKKKLPVSSSKLLKDTGNSKFTSTPAKSTAPISLTKDNISTPLSNKPALSSADKKRSTPKTHHMSVNFTPIRELNRLTASVMKKFESTRVGVGSSKASKNSSTPLKTPTMASKNEFQKHASMTPLTEKKGYRTKTPIDSTARGGNTAGPRWRLLSAENKIRSPIISSPFSLRTEERAARRKKKLEEKFNANESQKVQLHTKLKEKAETEIRKLRQSFCFKARPLPEFYKERKASKSETKDLMTNPASLKLGRKPISSVAESKSSLPPQRPSLDNGTKSFNTLTSSSIMITHENTSPNIQYGNQNDRNYK